MFEPLAEGKWNNIGTIITWLTCLPDESITNTIAIGNQPHSHMQMHRWGKFSAVSQQFKNQPLPTQVCAGVNTQVAFMLSLKNACYKLLYVCSSSMMIGLARLSMLQSCLLATPRVKSRGSTWPRNRINGACYLKSNVNWHTIGMVKI